MLLGWKQGIFNAIHTGTKQLCHGEDSHCRGVKNTGLNFHEDTETCWATWGWGSVEAEEMCGRQSATEGWLWKWLTEWGTGNKRETMAELWIGRFWRGIKELGNLKKEERGWAFLRMQAGCIIESALIFSHKTSDGCAMLMNTFKKQSF